MFRLQSLQGRMLAWLTALSAAGVLACGESGTEPGEGTGRVRVAMHDARGGPAGAVAPASYSLAEGSSFSGSMTAVTSVSVAAEGGAWIELGPPRQVTVQLQSTRDTAEVQGQAEAPAGTYSRVRIVMQEAHATVLAGSVVGGITLSGSLFLSLGSGSEVVVEKRVQPFRVSASTRAVILVDLNSEAWMTEQAAESRTVSESEVEEATEVTTRSEAEPKQ